MSTIETRSPDAAKAPRGLRTELKLEVVTIPVSDPARSKTFYERLGWRVDADIERGDTFRAVQMTAPGSPCSIHFGHGLTTAAPGSAQRLFLVVDDIEAARAELASRGVAVGEIFHGAPGAEPTQGRDPAGQTYASYAAFQDPDGNGWLLQEVTARLPGRVDAGHASFGSTTELAAALRRAEIAHGEHEKRTGQRDQDWPNWYATYLVAERSGEALPR